MNRNQPYDSSIKGIFEEDAASILPNLIEGVELVEVLDIEILRTPLRADSVYRVQYKKRPHTLQLEFQSGPDEDMAYRLAEYHTYLLRKYRLPVLSVVLYLFETSIVESPLREKSVDEELLTLHFRVLPLWKLNARNYIERQEISMYPMLPTMENVDKQTLLQAVEELIKYYENDNAPLARRLLWFGILLRRSQTVSPEDKQVVQERLKMYDDLLEKDAFVQRQKELGRELGWEEGREKGREEGRELGREEGREQGKEEGREQGKEEGAIQASQKILVDFVKIRYPSLVELAQQKAEEIDNASVLQEVIKIIFAVSNEETARALLDAA